tara:strand:+ start:324 stop:632 length:309 start_codon:yes stop_codon:yes gene_type:complete
MPNNNDNNNNNLPSMSVLSQMIQTQMSERGIDQARVQSLLNENGSDKSLNWQLLYKLLESAVEEFILINNGNPLADDFRNRVVSKMSDVVNILMGNQPPNNS